MNQFVESLKRLYQSDKITEEKLIQLLASEKITQEEYSYIKE